MPELLSTPLSADKTELISAITHSTRSTNLASIFRWGLAPGGIEGRTRNASNFNAYLPNDPRNVVQGRVGESYDALIVFVTDSLLKAMPMT
eukprot:3539062-Heterocapsa_arctica.AAC.1